MLTFLLIVAVLAFITLGLKLYLDSTKKDEKKSPASDLPKFTQKVEEEEVETEVDIVHLSSGEILEVTYDSFNSSYGVFAYENDGIAFLNIPHFAVSYILDKRGVKYVKVKGESK